VERIREEFASVLNGAPLGFADVARMEFTTQVIDESLRLYPPFWMVDREAIENDRVGDIEIPRGTAVIVFIYGAHHSPAYWDNPEQFLPERFSRENKKSHKVFTHLPFGGGPKGCIGGNYAMLQMLMILSVLLAKYDFTLAPDQVIEARPMIILRPRHGIKMTFTKRGN
jgi:cytochrome P450